MTSETKMIMDKLNEIKSELDFIKKHVVDEDKVLTEDDIKSLEEARKEFKEGKTTSLENLKKELA